MDVIIMKGTAKTKIEEASEVWEEFHRREIWSMWNWPVCLLNIEILGVFSRVGSYFLQMTISGDEKRIQAEDVNEVLMFTRFDLLG